MPDPLFVAGFNPGESDWKLSVRLVTASALASNTFATTDGGTLTASANGTLSVDGVAVVASDRILVKDEPTTLRNGIYVASDIGSGSTPWILVRADDANESSEVTSGLTVFASEGSANADTVWGLTGVSTVVLNTTALTFTQQAHVADIVAGDGLSKAGTTLAVDLSTQAGLEFSSGKLQLNADAMPALGLTLDSANVATVENLLDLKRETSGTAANGIGSSVTFTTEDSGGGTDIVAAIEVSSTDVSPSSEDAAVSFRAIAGGTLQPASLVVYGTVVALGAGLNIGRTAVTSSPYTVLGTDYYLGVSTAAARTINLPAVSVASAGRTILIKDETGQCAANNITVDGNASETIDGSTTVTMAVNYMSVTLVCTGSAWAII